MLSAFSTVDAEFFISALVHASFFWLKNEGWQKEEKLSLIYLKL